MKPFKAALINEAEKMYRKKKAIVIVVISLVSIILGQLMILIARKGLGIRGVSGVSFPLFVLDIFVQTILPLFTILVAIDVFSGEFSRNTMKIAVSAPITRFKLFSAKVTAVGVFTMINLMVVMILSLLIGIILDFSSLSIEGILQVFISYVVTIVPVMALALTIIFFANIFRSGTAIFFLAILAFLVQKIVELYYSSFSSILLTSMLYWHKYWDITSLSPSLLLKEFFLMAGYVIIFFTAGYYLFENKDL